MITVYGRDGCKFCEKAVWLLESKEMDFQYFMISDNPSVSRLAKAAGMTTVPVIFRGDQLIGGYTELAQQIL